MADVALLVTCECGTQFHTDAANVGREARCFDCGRTLTVTNAPAEEQAWQDVRQFRAPLSGKAILSLILGVTALALTIVTGIPAIALGCAGVAEIRRSRGMVRGLYLAIAGIALGVFGSTVIPFVVVRRTVDYAEDQRAQVVCIKRLRDLGTGFIGYHRARGTLPMAAIYDAKGNPLLSWRVALLPYLDPEGAALYDEFHLDEAWDSPHNRKLITRMPSVYACPKNPRAVSGMTTYQALVGPGTLFEARKPGRLKDVRLRAASTVLVVEADRPVPWTAPEDIPYDPADPGAMKGLHHEGAYFALDYAGMVLTMHADAPPKQLPSNGSAKFVKP